MAAAWRLALPAVGIGALLLVGVQQGLEYAGIGSIMQASLSAFAFIPRGLQIPAGFLSGQHAGVRSAASGMRAQRQALAPTMAAGGDTVYQFEMKDSAGDMIPLSNYSGKVLLIVNVASLDAKTDENYKGLAALYDRWAMKGLEILAFPSNQFGQETGSDEAIYNFTRSVGANFKVFSKVDVNGENECDLFKFLKKNTKNINPPLTGNGIKYNFEKFLVNRQGKPVARYAASTNAVKLGDEISDLI